MPFVYKEKQGVIVRLGFFLIVALLAIFGCWRLYQSLPGVGDPPDPKPDGTFWQNFWTKDVVYQVLVDTQIPLVEIPVKIRPVDIATITFGIILILCMAYLAFRQQRISEFLIDTESEMRKVSWPTTTEVRDSSFVVVIVIIALGVYLYGLDLILNKIFHIFF